MPRHVWVRHQSERDVTHNDATICPAPWERGSLSLPSPDRLVVPPFAQAFQQDYPRIRRLLNDHPRPGLGLFVSGADGLEASAWVPCGESGIEPVVIGRHSHAELFLPADVRLSLRHLVVVVHPGPARARVRFRVPGCAPRPLRAMRHRGPSRPLRGRALAGAPPGRRDRASALRRRHREHERHMARCTASPVRADGARHLPESRRQGPRGVALLPLMCWRSRRRASASRAWNMPLHRARRSVGPLHRGCGVPGFSSRQ